MRRLSAAGFKGDVAREIVLPDWWDDSCAADPAVLPEIELRVARFVDAPLAVIRDPGHAIAAPQYEGARLRRVRDIHRDKLAPAIHVGLRVAEAALRCWRGPLPGLRMPPVEPVAWRDQIRRPTPVVRLSDVLADVWERGIPVLHVGVMPSPSFQGMACVVGNRPVVVLAHDVDEPARLAFVIAHEVAHAVHGDCDDGHPIVDEDDVLPDDHAAEHRADIFAARALVGASPMPRLEEREPKELAKRAYAIEEEHGVDAALVIRRWGRETGLHDRATLAVKALNRMHGGKRLIREELDRRIDLDSASDTDRALLRCLHWDPLRHANAD